jgi:riboflavin-specific deaminase-like protein
MTTGTDADAATALGPALWDAMLNLRTAAMPARASDALLHTDMLGWQPHARFSDAEQAGFALYKPLLDAATSAATGRPWLLAQLGQSLDGCIATRSGDSNFVTGEASLLHLHRLRALCDAVLVGAGTVATDNPRLTTRRVSGAHPARVVFDPAARLDGRSRLFHDAQAPTWWACDALHAAQAQARLAAAGGGGAKVLGVPGLADAVQGPERLAQALQGLGLRLVLVEGGGITVSRLLATGCLDRLHLVTAPVLIGDGRPGLRLPPLHARMDDCPRPPSRVFALGEDRLWDLDLRALRGVALSV